MENILGKMVGIVFAVAKHLALKWAWIIKNLYFINVDLIIIIGIFDLEYCLTSIFCQCINH